MGIFGNYLVYLFALFYNHNRQRPHLAEILSSFCKYLLQMTVKKCIITLQKHLLFDPLSIGAGLFHENMLFSFLQKIIGIRHNKTSIGKVIFKLRFDMNFLFVSFLIEKLFLNISV